MGADERIGLGAVVASPIAFSNSVHSDHGLNKGHSKCRDRLGAVGSIDAGLTEGLTMLTGTVDQVISGLAAHARHCTGCCVLHASKAGRCIRADCAGGALGVVEEGVAGSTNSCAGASCASGDALNTGIVGDEPSILTAQADSSGRRSA